MQLPAQNKRPSGQKAEGSLCKYLYNINSVRCIRQVLLMRP